MSEPIERGSGEAFTAEHLGPVLEGQIGRYNHTQSFVSCAVHIEQKFGAELTGRHVAQRGREYTSTCSLSQIQMGWRRDF